MRHPEGTEPTKPTKTAWRFVMTDQEDFDEEDPYDDEEEDDRTFDEQIDD